MKFNAAQLEQFRKDGFMEIEFSELKPLLALQERLNQEFKGDPLEWHKQDHPQDEHIRFAKHLTDIVVSSGLVRELIAANLAPFKELLGPDIDIQTFPHFRLSRPETESDLIDWHRDVFYGTTAYETNVWFPIIPLEEGAGLLYIPGSHTEPSRNVREGVDSDPFRKTVTRGSEAHQVGYTYLPKIDDSVANLDPTRARLLRPAFGKAIYFFGCGIHRAQNKSKATRMSVDVRLKNALAPTLTKEGYYSPLTRGLMSECISRFSAT